MDLLIEISQGLGLAAAAGLLAFAPIAVVATAAFTGWLDGGFRFVDDGIFAVAAWIATGIELAADALWPGAAAGLRLGRRVVAGAAAFELSAHDALPWVGLVLGALVAGVVAFTLRQLRAGAVKAGGGLRGTAAIEDGAGLVASAAALVPPLGYLMAGAALVLAARVRRRDQQKYAGLRVLR